MGRRLECAADAHDRQRPPRRRISGRLGPRGSGCDRCDDWNVDGRAHGVSTLRPTCRCGADREVDGDPRDWFGTPDRVSERVGIDRHRRDTNLDVPVRLRRRNPRRHPDQRDPRPHLLNGRHLHRDRHRHRHRTAPCHRHRRRQRHRRCGADREVDGDPRDWFGTPDRVSERVGIDRHRRDTNLDVPVRLRRRNPRRHPDQRDPRPHLLNGRHLHRDRHRHRHRTAPCHRHRPRQRHRRCGADREVDGDPRDWFGTPDRVSERVGIDRHRRDTNLDVPVRLRRRNPRRRPRPARPSATPTQRSATTP